ncbi:4'-phosphopantetheinyl transferase family protein [Clostridium beijerinckii]|uniref:4'-phosphopantetheinyl transferase superfamily protein n=1 Tax=Clostridium beijerinckii TaxID=1520 RepID=A0A7X9SUE2_CLOBE|nr:4'-phosphopantetheinyl transferase superfamily protein [Clostridium beijerinckii]NMF07963.1 4'-phosphopantetheinyl transferase superfamily protein [Clostridium beijerinckii]
MIKIYAFNINEYINEKKIEEVSQKLDNYGSNIKRNFKFKEDLYSTTFGEVIVRLVLCKLLKLSNNELKFSRNDFGKPYLCNSSKYKFNISHSGDWIVLAFSNYDIGIDIERLSMLHLEVVNKFFAQDERDYIYNSDERNIKYRFFKIWTLKESYIKARGYGLSMELNKINVCEKRYNNEYVENTITIKGKDNKTYYSKTYDFEKEYIVSISSISNSFSNKIEKLSINDIDVENLNKLF